MKIRRIPSPAVKWSSIVYDTPSNMGGTFTVQIVEEDGERVRVQTIYGTLNTHGAFVPWDDCLEFWTTRSDLTNRRTFRKERTAA